MAKALQIVIIKHQLPHSEFMRYGFNRCLVMHFRCECAQIVRLAHFTNRIVSQLLGSKLFPSNRVNHLNVMRVSTHSASIRSSPLISNLIRAQSPSHRVDCVSCLCIRLAQPLQFFDGHICLYTSIACRLVSSLCIRAASIATFRIKPRERMRSFVACSIYCFTLLISPCYFQVCNSTRLIYILYVSLLLVLSHRLSSSLIRPTLFDKY